MKRVLNLTSPDRNLRRDRALGATLAFVAGATNAGGFLAVGQYTSHMTGIVSAIADALAFEHLPVAAAAACALIAFLCGAVTTAVTVNWARRRQLRSLFAIPLLLEATLLLTFGLLGWMRDDSTALLAPATVLMLCYLMGLQNAVITKISKAEIRTTHVTGLVTDIGIELGRLIYVNQEEREKPERVNRERLGVHLLLFSCFLGGGVVGALGFKTIGFFATIPLAMLLVVIGLKPVAEDLKEVF